jgi:hypothetical protein
MSKGSQPAGTTTTTQNTVNPVQQGQQPFFDALYKQAGNLSGISPGGTPTGQNYLDMLQGYAGQNFANAQGPAGMAVGNAATNLNQLMQSVPSQLWPTVSQINNMANLSADRGQEFGRVLSGVANEAPGAIERASTGLYGNAAGIPGALAPYMSSLAGNAGMAVTGNPAIDALMPFARGDYIDPSKNPALAGTLKAGLDPLTRQYMTATAPQTDAGFEKSGRYGSGVLSNAVSQNEQNLGRAQGDLTSQIINNAYNTGMTSAVNAGNAVGGIYNTGIGNVTSALGTGGNIYNTGISNANQALASAGTMSLQDLQQRIAALTAGAGATNTGVQTGAGAWGAGGNLLNTGVQTQGGLIAQAPTIGNYPLTQLTSAFNAPWLPAQNLAGILGTPNAGTSDTTGTQPYFQNKTADIMSGIGGALGIAAKAVPLIGSLFPSDRRIKEDIEKVGALDEDRGGFAVYRFRYKGDPRPQIGLMAQDVEKVRPSAVVSVGGLKMVDYREATKRA